MVNMELRSLGGNKTDMSENEIIGFIKSGKYRRIILSLVAESSVIPSEIALEIGITRSQVSRTLSELEKNGLITCETPNRTKGRIYKTTEKGSLLLKTTEEK